MDTVISVQNLKKKFSNAFAVDNVSFEVQRGEILSFLGPNGAGKTTTIAMLLGLLTPDDGEIKILDMRMPRDRRKILSRVNFSSPYVNMPYGLHVDTNINIFSRLYSVKNAKKKINDLAEIFGVTHLLSRRTMALSSGETARVNLLKAFLNDPEILFLDEPSGGLDPISARMLDDLILQLKSSMGTTVVVITHELASIFSIGNDSVFLDTESKTIIASGNPKKLLEECDNATVRRFLTRGASEPRIQAIGRA